MKYLCEGCERLVEATRFLVDGSGELVLTCARCGTQTRAGLSAAAAPVPAAVPSVPSVPFTAQGPPPPAAPAPAAPAPAPAPARVVPLHVVPPPAFGVEEPFSVPADRCPKCVAPRREGALVCRQCGLTFVNFVASEHEPPEELRQSWKELISRWGDLGAHDHLLGIATVRGQLAAVGRLYRIRLARQPQDPIAQRGRDEVLRLASSASTLLPERPPSLPGALKVGKKTFIWIALFLLLAATAATIWMVSQVRLPPPVP